MIDECPDMFSIKRFDSRSEFTGFLTWCPYGSSRQQTRTLSLTSPPWTPSSTLCLLTISPRALSSWETRAECFEILEQQQN